MRKDVKISPSNLYDKYAKQNKIKKSQNGKNYLLILVSTINHILFICFNFS